jgi:ribosomal protein S18 acetylase RimI-like enzyme
MKIAEIRPDEYDRAAELWEASVRATHDFVTEADLDVFRPAVGFYQHHGFRVVSRSENDPTKKPYPILHLRLESAG